MKTVQEVHKCPFCGSKNLEEINRYSVIDSSAMWASDERIDEEGECTIFVKPVNYFTTIFPNNFTKVI